MKQSLSLLLFFNLLYSSLFAAQSGSLALENAHSYHSEENIPNPLALLKMTQEERQQLVLRSEAPHIKLLLTTIETEIDTQFTALSCAINSLSVSRTLLKKAQTPFRLLEQQVDEKTEEINQAQAYLEELIRKKQLAEQEFKSFAQAEKEQHLATQKKDAEYNSFVLLRQEMFHNIVQQAEKTDGIRRLASELQITEEQNAALLAQHKKQIETAEQWEKITPHDIPQESTNLNTSNNPSWINSAGTLVTSAGTLVTSAGAALIIGANVTFSLCKKVVS